MKKVIKKLDELTLEHVSGGRLSWRQLSLSTCVGSAPVILGCSVAGLVCQCKGKKRRIQGDAVCAEKLEKAGRVLTDVAIGAGAVGTLGLIGAFTLPRKTIFSE